MAKPNRFLLYGGVAVFVAAALFMTEPTKKPSMNKAASKARSAVPTKGDESGILPEDHTVNFTPVALIGKDVFKPLVVRDTGGSADAAMPNQVPPSFAGGEAGWFYTGTAIVDQVPTALLENTQTGAGLYVKQGDMWKDCKVDRITPTTLTLTSGDTSRTLLLLADSPNTATGPSTQPLNPLTGPVNVQSRPNPLPGAVPQGRGGRTGGPFVPNAPGGPAGQDFAAPPVGVPTGGGQDLTEQDLNLSTEVLL